MGVMRHVVQDCNDSILHCVTHHPGRLDRGPGTRARHAPCCRRQSRLTASFESLAADLLATSPTFARQCERIEAEGMVRMSIRALPKERRLLLPRANHHPPLRVRCDCRVYRDPCPPTAAGTRRAARARIRARARADRECRSDRTGGSGGRKPHVGRGLRDGPGAPRRTGGRTRGGAHGKDFCGEAPATVTTGGCSSRGEVAEPLAELVEPQVRRRRELRQHRADPRSPRASTASCSAARSRSGSR